MTFRSSDGSIKCHSKLLTILSPFFETKINGSKSLDGCLEFDYEDYDTKTVQWFLNYCYCATEPIETLTIAESLKIMHFLHAEGKNVVSGIHLKLIPTVFKKPFSYSK